MVRVEDERVGCMMLNALVVMSLVAVHTRGVLNPSLRNIHSEIKIEAAIELQNVQ